MSVDIDALLKKVSQMKASDLHIKVGNVPIVRINGALHELKDEKIQERP
jgi:Tfp pilus assembly pilus retraction ATPase PilT